MAQEDNFDNDLLTIRLPVFNKKTLSLVPENNPPIYLVTVKT